jgi:hypothetical protein
MENTTPLLAFHEDTTLFAATTAQVKKHVESKQILQGIYVMRDSGAIRYVSSMGAILHGSDPSIGERKYGIPAALMELQEGLFDLLEAEKCTKWPIWFLGMMRCGADLRPVVSEFFVWLLFERESPVLEYVHRDEDREAVMEAVYLHRQRIDCGFFERDEEVMKEWEVKMRKLIDTAEHRGDATAHLALKCAFFSLYARFSTGGALTDGLALYRVTADGEMIEDGMETAVSAAAKELLRLIGGK